MILYHTTDGVVVEHLGRYYRAPGSWDDVFNDPARQRLLDRVVATTPPLAGPPRASHLRPPLGSQEVWAAGVTYNRSRVARMADSKLGGGSDFYDRVYHAVRPELFFKATPHRVVGHGGVMHLRRDSGSIVPEPELTIAIDAGGRVVGYTIGNDLSCRDLEGENPLYLPQAKTFTACAALGPGLLVTGRRLPRATSIVMEIRRRGRVVFAGTTHLSQIRRPLPLLVEYLHRDNSFPAGCLLMTGTGIVPPARFTLRRGDLVRITIPPIGTLTNRMA